MAALCYVWRVCVTHGSYVPVLTDEDLAEDPPDHRSGYVAVIGKPNAGEAGWWGCGCQSYTDGRSTHADGA